MTAALKLCDCDDCVREVIRAGVRPGASRRPLRRAASRTLGVPGPNFAGFFSGVTQYLRADAGLSKTGSIVNSWADLSGNGANVTEGSAGVGIGTATAGLNGHAGIAADGSTQWGTFNLNIPLPGTTPTFHWTVWRLNVQPAANAFLTNAAANSAALFINLASTQFFGHGGAGPIGPITLTLGAWGRSEALFSNSALDYIKFGPTVVNPGGSAGNVGSTARGLFAQPNGSGKIAAEILVHITCQGIQSAAALAAAGAAANAWFGTTLT